MSIFRSLVAKTLGLCLFAALALLPTPPCAARPEPQQSPAQVMVRLSAALPSGKTLSTANAEEVMQALAPFHNDAELYAEAASLVALARPAMLPAIERQVNSLFPPSAKAIISTIKAASLHPTPGQLSALIDLEGLSPAAGEDDNGSDS